MEEGGGGELFADGFERVKFWRGLEEERCVVAKDSNHDHDNEDGQEDPVAKSWVQEERLGGPRHRDRGRFEDTADSQIQIQAGQIAD